MRRAAYDAVVTGVQQPYLATGLRLSAGSLEYRIEEETENAHHLLVTWPGLHPGVVPPTPTLERLHRFRAHKLSIGADEQTYVGPQGTMRGAQASVELLRAEMQRLGVRRENVITYGPSVRGVCALWMGFQAGAGRVIAGAPPVRMGRRLRTIDRVVGANPDALAFREHFLALADRQDGIPGDFVLDELIYGTARAVTEPTTVHLFVSRDDEMYEDTVELAEALDHVPAIRCDLHVASYGHHGEVKEPFKKYLADTLSEVGVPRRPRSD